MKMETHQHGEIEYLQNQQRQMQRDMETQRMQNSLRS